MLPFPPLERNVSTARENILRRTVLGVASPDRWRPTKSPAPAVCREQHKNIDQIQWQNNMYIIINKYINIDNYYKNNLDQKPIRRIYKQDQSWCLYHSPVYTIYSNPFKIWSLFIINKTRLAMTHLFFCPNFSWNSIQMESFYINFRPMKDAAIPIFLVLIYTFMRKICYRILPVLTMHIPLILTNDLVLYTIFVCLQCLKLPR